MSDSSADYVFMASECDNIEATVEIKVSNDLYIMVHPHDDYIDLHSHALDEDGSIGVLIGKEELDDLIEALMQLRKELEED